MGIITATLKLLGSHSALESWGGPVDVEGDTLHVNIYPYIYESAVSCDRILMIVSMNLY